MNLDKIRERLDSFNKQAKPNGTRVVWKPEPGAQVVRLLPYVHNKEWPFLELYFYYDLAKKTIISPQNFGEPDPVQELANRLKATGEKEDWLLARKIEPKMRTYVPVLVRGKENEGVKFWGFGKTVYEELLKTIDDPDYGDITDLKNGSDITVEYEKPKDGYPKTTFRVKRNSTPATTDSEVIQLLKEMPTIREIWEPPTYDELAEILNNFINNEESEDSSENSDDDGDDFINDLINNTGNEDREAKGSTSVVDDIDSAFDAMFS